MIAILVPLVRLAAVAERKKVVIVARAGLRGRSLLVNVSVSVKESVGASKREREIASAIDNILPLVAAAEGEEGIRTVMSAITSIIRRRRIREVRVGDPPEVMISV
jgi:hypothetical protein